MAETPRKTVNVIIDDEVYQVEEGITVLNACLANGIYIPHFCYHPCLSIAGNCRMCLVKIEKIPKLAISCATNASEGMRIYTKVPEVIKARESIMEFLLINHPLDCPVCDQAGECVLQDYAYDYGRDIGRFREKKVIRHTKDLGKHVKYWGNRCIVCTRCVRYCKEISGTGELGVLYRGDHSAIDIFPGQEINNPISMNVIDICPVGALVSADFLYQARAWFLSQKKSICPECSKGCNTRIDSLDNEIKRIIARRNDVVNKSFMCDHGRLSFDYIYSENRLQTPKLKGKEISWKEAIESFKLKIEDYVNKSAKLAILVSAWNSNETLYILKRLKIDFFKYCEFFFYSKAQEPEQLFPQFKINADKNPNINGIRVIYDIDHLDEKPVTDLINKIQKGEITGLLIVGGLPDGSMPKELSNINGKLENLIVIDHTKSILSDEADLLLPSLTYAEKSGSYINDKNRLQRVFAAINPVTNGKPEDVIIQELMRVLSGHGEIMSGSGIFDSMREIASFRELNYQIIGDLGIEIT